eukprot:Nitzschia sp. Nitz4//scaffold169_size48518//5450//6565//NITZ4_007062-RA/size48518-processed-gene-0.86-mRNA-1//-1//CDS//3329538358//3029//frame0
MSSSKEESVPTTTEESASDIPSATRGGKDAPRKRRPTKSRPNEDPPARQMRQRRARMLRDKYNEEQDMQKIRTAFDNPQGYHRFKVTLVIFCAVVATILAALHIFRPSALYGLRRKPAPPLYLATRFPPDVVIDRDLPRFFQSYSIATPANAPARAAVQQLARSREAVQRGTGNWRVVLRGWDSSNVQKMFDQQICGAEFEQVYRSTTTSDQRREDMVMWCLLATRVVEGFFQGSVEMLSNVFILARKRGMIVSTASSTERLSHLYYLHPRLPGENVDVTAPIPATVLSWLLAHPEDSLENPVEELQTFLHDLLEGEEMSAPNRYMRVEEICQDSRPYRAIAQHCTASTECCYFVVPEAEGGVVLGAEDGD